MRAVGRKRWGILATIAVLLLLGPYAGWRLFRGDQSGPLPARSPRTLPPLTRGTYPPKPDLTFRGEAFVRAAASGPGLRVGKQNGVLDIRVSGKSAHRIAAFPMPEAVSNPARATLINARVEIPATPSSGSGVFCRGTSSGAALDEGYALVVNRTGQWLLIHVHERSAYTLRVGHVPTDQLSAKGPTTWVQLSCERPGPGAEQWFVVRTNRSKAMMVRVTLRVAPPSGGQVGIAVLHDAPKGGVTSVRADALSVHTIA